MQDQSAGLCAPYPPYHIAAGAAGQAVIQRYGGYIVHPDSGSSSLLRPVSYLSIGSIIMQP